jgi:hypothetical protein
MTWLKIIAYITIVLVLCFSLYFLLQYILMD